MAKTTQLNLAEVVSILQLHWKVLIGAAAVAAFVTYVANRWIIDKTYEVKTTIMSKTGRSASSLDSVIGQLGGAAALGGLMGVGGVGMASETQQFQIILKSAQLARDVAKLPGISEKLLGRALNEEQLDRDLNSISVRIRRTLTFKLEIGALHMSYQHRDPEAAQMVMEGYLTALQNFLNNNIVTQSKNAELFVKARLQELTANVSEAEKELIRLRTGGQRPAEGLRSLQSEIERKEREFLRYNQLLDLLSQQYELSQIESKRSDPMFLVVERPVKPLSPIGPKTIDNTAIAFVLVVVMGTLGLIARPRIKYLLKA